MDPESDVDFVPDEDFRRVLKEKTGCDLLERIGSRGSCGVVYRAKPSGEGGDCAIKISHARFSDPLGKSKHLLLREARALCLLKAHPHAHMLHLVDYWTDIDDHLVSRWELAVDGSLLEKLAGEKGSGIPKDELLRYMRDLAECIDYLRKMAIWHREHQTGQPVRHRGMRKNWVT